MKMSFKGVFALFVLCIVTLGLFTTTFAQGGGEKFYASSERWQYTGTMVKYATLQDALEEQNPLSTPPIAWPARDGSVYTVRNVPSVFSDCNIIMVNWYAIYNGEPESSPNNDAKGFLQMYDDNASNWQNQKAWWSKDALTFTLTAKGKNATYGSADPEDWARLWSGGSLAGRGTFLKYDYSMTAVFDSPAVRDDVLGVYKNVGNAVNISGHIKGIFQGTSAGTEGFYVFDLTISGGGAFPNVNHTPSGSSATYITGQVADEFWSSLKKGN